MLAPEANGSRLPTAADTDFDAIIVGAGVAGCTAAILLAQAGWSVAVVEKSEFPRRKVCGECIAASNLPLLDALGIGEALDRFAGAPLQRVGLFVGNERVLAPLPSFDHAAHAWGRALGREHLDSLLLQRARALGATVWQPWTLRAVDRDGDRHACRLHSAKGEESLMLHAPVVIDAHGSWEPDPTGGEPLRSPRRNSDLFAFKGNFRNADLDSDLLPVLAFPGGYGGMVLAGDGVLTVACCIRRDTLHALRAAMPGAKAAAAVDAHLQASCLGVRDALRGAQVHDAWLSVGPIRPGIRSPAPAPGRFAIGNAAGEAHPILGEGISMAIQSAWLLCERLIVEETALRAHGEPRASANARVALDYAHAWRQHFVARIRLAAVFSQLAMRPSGARVLLPMLRRWPGLLTRGARLGGKTRCAVPAVAVSSLGNQGYRSAAISRHQETR
ncbi:MAG: NAD(P)/FAD-dependent oxidoreductase [Arenimonas sp.]